MCCAVLCCTGMLLTSIAYTVPGWGYRVMALGFRRCPTSNVQNLMMCLFGMLFARAALSHAPPINNDRQDQPLIDRSHQHHQPTHPIINYFTFQLHVQHNYSIITVGGFIKGYVYWVHTLLISDICTLHSHTHSSYTQP